MKFHYSSVHNLPFPHSSVKRLQDSSQNEEEPQEKKKKITNLKEVFHSLPCGVVLSLGTGEFGQLGLGEVTTTRKKPALVKSALEGKNIKKIIAGGVHTVCLTDDYQVYTFGCNDEGSLGRLISDDSEEFEPGLVTGALDNVKIVDISAGDSHTAALSEDGSVYLWGSFRDSHGKLGLFKQSNGSGTPVKIESIGHPVIKIASGTDHLVMIADNGKVYTLGSSEQGQLGRISRYFTDRGGRRTAKLCLCPATVHLPRVGETKQIAKDVFCGAYSTYILSESGSVFAFGLNNYNQLGIPDQEDRLHPVYVPVLSNKSWIMFASGMHHLILLDKKGEVFGLGRGQYGRLGLGDDADVDIPTKIPGLVDITRVSAGSSVSFAVSKSGKAYGWGEGTNLQLTTGEEDDELQPVELSGKNLEERCVLDVDAGGQHTVVLACDKSDFVNGHTS